MVTIFLPILPSLFISVDMSDVGLSDVISTATIHSPDICNVITCQLQGKWFEFGRKDGPSPQHGEKATVLSEEGSKTSQNMSHSESAGLCCASG